MILTFRRPGKYHLLLQVMESKVSYMFYSLTRLNARDLSIQRGNDFCGSRF